MGYASRVVSLNEPTARSLSAPSRCLPAAQRPVSARRRDPTFCRKAHEPHAFVGLATLAPTAPQKASSEARYVDLQSLDSVGDLARSHPQESSRFRLYPTRPLQSGQEPFTFVDVGIAQVQLRYRGGA